MIKIMIKVKKTRKNLVLKKMEKGIRMIQENNKINRKRKEITMKQFKTKRNETFIILTPSLLIDHQQSLYDHLQKVIRDLKTKN